ncbi:hypothetical protein PAXRUDRAFT_20879 [Paxillus rubicundulus Ve08.2h10]|uniref:Unplaced genomic scaffold scaffold_4954, whole genome shotgun sequence n=1 Tax=Paxillus rubicundulus Ve08.2h10 TaxID=930991 RepID=A0A0D0CRJ1_9AGAM|nr:hypothetical protein PAXRUDRAFT_20879 [Paxillus rubicundulus Ve08.2h10]
MSHAIEHRQEWCASHDWVIEHLDEASNATSDSSLSLCNEVLDVLECLPWDVPLKGFGARTNLQSSGLQPLLALAPLSGHVLEMMIESVVNQMGTSDLGQFDRLCVELLALMDSLCLSGHRWERYNMDKAFTHLHALGKDLEPVFVHTADVKLDASDVPLDVVLQQIAAGGNLWAGGSK